MSRQRSAVSLLVAFSFIVLAVTGVLAFILPFSIRIVGLHALIGFGFVGLIAFHVFNNFRQLAGYLRSRVVWGTLVATLIWVAVFLWQPAPVRKVLRLSGNLSPALDRFEVTDEGMRYRYVPDPRYRMDLNVRKGAAFDTSNPPNFAIWLENASHYHIKTLHTSQSPTTPRPLCHTGTLSGAVGKKRSGRRKPLERKSQRSSNSMPSPERLRTVPSIRPITFCLMKRKNLCLTACSSRLTKRMTTKRHLSMGSTSTMPTRALSSSSISSAIRLGKKATMRERKNGLFTMLMIPSALPLS